MLARQPGGIDALDTVPLPHDQGQRCTEHIAQHGIEHITGTFLFEHKGNTAQAQHVGIQQFDDLG